jgi:hypothetical protein
MRRSERAVTDEHELDVLLKTGRICHLGLKTDDRPYVIPVNYGFATHDNDRWLYFHGATEGRKLDLLRADPQVSFSIVVSEELVRGDAGCSWTSHYASVLGEGEAEIIEDPAGKQAGLATIMAHYGVTEPSFPDKVVAATLVVRIRITALWGKRNQ